VTIRDDNFTVDAESRSTKTTSDLGGRCRIRTCVAFATDLQSAWWCPDVLPAVSATGSDLGRSSMVVPVCPLTSHSTRDNVVTSLGTEGTRTRQNRLLVGRSRGRGTPWLSPVRRGAANFDTELEWCFGAGRGRGSRSITGRVDWFNPSIAHQSWCWLEDMSRLTRYVPCNKHAIGVVAGCACIVHWVKSAHGFKPKFGGERPGR
jgi:hypothetical protein